MADHPLYNGVAKDYKDHAKTLNVDVGTRDGYVYIDLAPGGDYTSKLKVALEPEQAKQVRQALDDALFRLRKL